LRLTDTIGKINGYSINSKEVYALMS
jgi:hypothetical protein